MLSLLSVFQEPVTTKKRVKVAIIFPSRVCEEYVTVRETESHDVLELGVEWRMQLLDYRT